ncbi:phage tail protein [Pseudomonas alliivorans]|nr:phage tail protein [Pseudomonas alliivorans]
MDYPKSVPGVGLVSGKFVDENPATGTPGSLIPAQWGNAVTQEILNVILGAGLAPSEADVTQLHRAILGLAASDYKKSVRCATTMAIGLSGLQTIDDVTLVAGDRVLVKNQDNPAQNWIYLAAADAWTRAQDANESTECTPGHLVPVQAGTRNGGTVWQLTNTTAPVLGTTGLLFERALGRSGVAAGNYSRVKVNSYGQVEEGSNPTTLAGYGVSDAYTKSEVDLRDIARPLRDSISHVGMANNQPDAPYMRRESDGGVYYLQPRLGFVPIQQGGGVGQQGNPIKLGWSGSNLKATVDSTDLGNLWYSGNFNPASKANYADVYLKSEVDTRVGGRAIADSILHVGLSGGDMAQPYMRRASDSSICWLQPRLGYTPIQQGGGANMKDNKIFMGYNNAGSLRLQVDSTDFGDFVNDQNLLGKVAAIGVGSIGSYAFARVINSQGAVNQGGFVAGVNMIYSSTNTNDGGTNSSGAIGVGTWRVHGAFSANERTLFQRVN